MTSVQQKTRTLWARSLALTLAIVFATSGCGLIYHQREDWIVQREAKHEFDSYFAEQPAGKHARHYERGWRQGFYDVSRKGKACPPTLPPQPYWSAKYKNAAGPIHVEQWYRGYADGAEYAQSCGIKPTLPWRPNGCIEPRPDACSPCGNGVPDVGSSFDAYVTPHATVHPLAAGELIELPNDAPAEHQATEHHANDWTEHPAESPRNDSVQAAEPGTGSASPSDAVE